MKPQCFIVLLAICGSQGSLAQVPLAYEDLEVDSTIMGYGSIYIQCESGPFYFQLDSLIGQGQWHNSPDAKLGAIPKGVYFQDGGKPLNGVEADLAIEGPSGRFAEILDASVDTLSHWPSNEGAEAGYPIYPSLGMALFKYRGYRYLFRMINAYQGGCRHDILSWIIRE